MNKKVNSDMVMRFTVKTYDPNGSLAENIDKVTIPSTANISMETSKFLKHNDPIIIGTHLRVRKATNGTDYAYSTGLNKKGRKISTYVDKNGVTHTQIGASYLTRDTYLYENKTKQCIVNNEGYEFSDDINSKNIGVRPGIILNGNYYKKALETNPFYVIEHRNVQLYDTTPDVEGTGGYYDLEDQYGVNVNKHISYNDKRVGSETQHIITFGEYPQSKIEKDLEKQLSSLEKQKALKETGVKYGFDENNLATEYEYEGQKYAKTNDGKWFKVEAIKWRIINWDDLPKTINPNGIGKHKNIRLVSESVLFSGMSIGEKGYNASTLRKYLNGQFIEQIVAGENKRVQITTQELNSEIVNEKPEIKKPEKLVETTNTNGEIPKYVLTPKSLGYEDVSKPYPKCKIDRKMNICYPTDYAVMNGLALDPTKDIKSNSPYKYAGSYFLRTETEDGYQHIIDGYGNLAYTNKNNTQYGIRMIKKIPVKDYEILMKANKELYKIESENIAFDETHYMMNNGITYYYDVINYGEYPNSFVGKKENELLEKEFNSGKLKPTGRTFEGQEQNDGTIPQNEEYEYKGEKYVRVKVLTNSEPYSQPSEYQDGTKPEEVDSYAWVKVEPMKWMIINWDDLPKSINPKGTGKETEIKLASVNIIDTSKGGNKLNKKIETQINEKAFTSEKAIITSFKNDEFI